MPAEAPGPPTPTVPATVLLVEDDAATSDMYRTALALEGLDVFQAWAVPEALRHARELQPDVILTDIGLPGTDDGVEFARRLREDAMTAKIPIIAVTGRDLPDQELVGELFDDVIVKPVKLPMMVDRLRAAIIRGRRLQD